jgi:flagellar motor switch/type III secretory pathway protein FliN
MLKTSPNLEWAASLLAQAMQRATSAAGQEASIEFGGSGAASPAAGDFWWAQELSLLAGHSVWIGAPEKTWAAIGGSLLAELGVENPAPDDCRDTWKEIATQSVSGLAAELAGELATTVTGGKGTPDVLPSAEAQIARMVVLLGENPPLEVYFGIAGGLLRTCEVKLSAGKAALNSDPTPEQRVNELVTVEMPVSLTFGKVFLSIEELLSLTPGSIIPLNLSADSPGELKMGNRTFARGPIVDVDGYYGLTIADFGRKTPVRGAATPPQGRVN